MSRDSSTEKPVNSSTSSPTHVVILGSDFTGIEVLKKLQKKFDTDGSVVVEL
jgi:kynurenine formamidase